MNIIKIILSLVRIIEVSDDRGSDNRGSTVQWNLVYLVIVLKLRYQESSLVQQLIDIP